MTVNQRVSGSSPEGGADNQSLRESPFGDSSFLPVICQQSLNIEGKILLVNQIYLIYWTCSAQKLKQSRPNKL